MASSLVSVHPRVRGILSQILVSCDFSNEERLGCLSKVPLGNLRMHVASCAFRPGAAPHSPLRKVITPSSSVHDVLTASPSKLQGNVAKKVTAHLVQAQEEGGVLSVQLKEGCRPQTWTRVTKGQAGTKCSDRTVKRRTTEITGLREVVCAGPSGASAQQAYGVKQLSTTDQEQLLQDAGLIPKASGALGSGLALKADLHLPWFKVRKLRCWLTSFGVSLDSESAMREQISTELPFDILSELVPLSTKSGSTEMKELVHFTDVGKLVLHYLCQPKSANYLWWHNSALPSSEVWVKIGGDHELPASECAASKHGSQYHSVSRFRCARQLCQPCHYPPTICWAN